MKIMDIIDRKEIYTKHHKFVKESRDTYKDKFNHAEDSLKDKLSLGYVLCLVFIYKDYRYDGNSTKGNPIMSHFLDRQTYFNNLGVISNVALWNGYSLTMPKEFKYSDIIEYLESLNDILKKG